VQVTYNACKAQSKDGIERLAKDLKREFPDIKGFSARNLKYMRSFAEAYPDEQIVQQAAAQIPWFHNLQGMTQPIGVSTHRIGKDVPEQLKGILSTVEQLEMELGFFVQTLEKGD
jgi:DUF1016 N-terminal domain